MSNPTTRIHLIERSLRCFVYGWLSLIPAIGLVATFSAFRHFSKSSLTVDAGWNPAASYRRAGLCLASIGLLISIGGLALILIAVINS